MIVMEVDLNLLQGKCVCGGRIEYGISSVSIDRGGFQRKEDAEGKRFESITNKIKIIE